MGFGQLSLLELRVAIADMVTTGKHKWVSLDLNKCAKKKKTKERLRLKSVKEQ